MVKWSSPTTGTRCAVWDLQTGKQLAVFEGDPDSGHSFQMVPGSRQLLVANPDHSIRVVDMTTWQEVGRWKPHPDAISDVAISPDGRRLLVCTRGDQEGAFVWDVASGQEVGRLGGLGKSLPRVAVFAPDGRRAISIDQECTIILWDVAGGKELQRWQKQGDVVSVAIAPDGRDALFGLFSHKAFLMRLPAPPPPAKPELLYSIPWQDEQQGFPAHIFQTGISSDGRLFFGAGDAGPTGAIRVWEVATGKQVQELVPGGDAWYSFAQFLPGGKYLVAELHHKEKDLYLWDIATGKVVRKFVGHTEPRPRFRRLAGRQTAPFLGRRQDRAAVGRGHRQGTEEAGGTHGQGGGRLLAGRQAGPHLQPGQDAAAVGRGDAARNCKSWKATPTPAPAASPRTANRRCPTAPTTRYGSGTSGPEKKSGASRGRRPRWSSPGSWPAAALSSARRATTI